MKLYFKYLVAVLLLLPQQLLTFAQDDSDELITEITPLSKSGLSGLNQKEYEENFDSIYASVMNLGDTTERLAVQLEKARILFIDENRSEALRIVVNVYNSLETEGSLKFESGKQLRNYYYTLGAFEKAVETHMELDWNHAPDDWEKHVPDHFLAYIYLEIGAYESSIEILENCITTLKNEGYPYWQMSLTNSLGVVYEKNNQLDSAWNKYTQARTILENNFQRDGDIDYDFIDGLFLGNQAQILAKNGEHLQAIPLYKIDIKNSFKEPTTFEKRQNGLLSQLKLAQSYVAIDQYQLAGSTVRALYPNLKECSDPKLELDYLLIKWKLCRKKGDSTMALNAAESYLMLRDSIESAESKQSLQNIQIAYEARIKERKLSEKEAELKFLRSAKKRERYALVGALLLVAILLFISVYILSAFRQRVKNEHELALKTKKIEDQSKTIQKSLEEKDLLLREIHHRVKNNLQIISSLFFIQSKKIDDEYAKSIIQEGQSRVHVMSLIHQKLYQSDTLNNINFQEYISDLARQILQSNHAKELQIDLVIEASDITESVELAVPVGMIINELLTNSIKHGFVGRKMGQIHIDLKRKGEWLQLIYEDDGKGLSTLESLEKNDSLGMRLIRLLASQLDGAIEFSAAKGFKISIEIEAKKHKSYTEID